MPIRSGRSAVSSEPFSCQILRGRFAVRHSGGKWRHENNKKYPHYITLIDQPYFTVAGIWEYNPTLQIRSVSLITTEANPLSARIHNSKKRMPAIISPENRKLWLSENLPVQDLVDQLLQPYDEREMDAYPINKLITSRGVDTNVAQVKEQEEYPELTYQD